MYYTLQELQDLIAEIIEREGADAPCAAWLCTAHDLNDIVDERIYPSATDPELAQRVLTNITNLPDNHIFMQIQDRARRAVDDERNVGVGTT